MHGLYLSLSLKLLLITNLQSPFSSQSLFYLLLCVDLGSSHYSTSLEAEELPVVNVDEY